MKLGVTCLAYSSEHHFLVSGGFEHELIVWNPYVQQLIVRLPGHVDSICGVEAVPHTPVVISADRSGMIRIWDLRLFRCIQTLTAEGGGLNAIAVPTHQVLQRHHHHIVAAGASVGVFNSHKVNHPESTDDDPVKLAIFNENNLTFATVSESEVKIYSSRNGQLLLVHRRLGESAGQAQHQGARRVGAFSEVTALCLDGRQRKIFVGNHIGNIIAYDYQSGTRMKVILQTCNPAHPLTSFVPKPPSWLSLWKPKTTDFHFPGCRIFAHNAPGSLR